jgi:hypothetical protein
MELVKMMALVREIVENNVSDKIEQAKVIDELNSAENLKKFAELIYKR